MFHSLLRKRTIRKVHVWALLFSRQNFLPSFMFPDYLKGVGFDFCFWREVPKNHMGSGWTEVLFSSIHVHTLTVISRSGDWSRWILKLETRQQDCLEWRGLGLVKTMITPCNSFSLFRPHSSELQIMLAIELPLTFTSKSGRFVCAQHILLDD